MSDAKKILLADDDVEDQEILEDALLKEEPTAKIHSVSNGKEVVEYLINCEEINLPCIIILDYQMPILNAAEVLTKINQDPRLESIPKVVWSSSSVPEHIKNCIDGGAREYFVKPAKFSEMANIATQILDLCGE